MIWIVLGLLVVFFVLWKYKDYDNKKCEKFVKEHSISLMKIREINERYTFNPNQSFKLEHTYDNENFFNQISCESYLIYQMQFNHRKILQQISSINKNKELYDLYIAEVKKAFVEGEFTEQCKPNKLKKIMNTEKTICNRILKKPETEFVISVYLYCATINGRVYRSKKDCFYQDEIKDISNRLSNKSGSFYKDRGIWDSICIVERGKVSNKIRFSIYNRDHYRCRYCGATERDDYLEVDHIVPIAKGGKSTYDNLQTLCRRCNARKSDSMPGNY